MPYKLTTADGNTVKGITDESGLTQRVSTSSSMGISIEPDTDTLSGGGEA